MACYLEELADQADWEAIAGQTSDIDRQVFAAFLEELKKSEGNQLEVEIDFRRLAKKLGFTIGKVRRAFQRLESRRLISPIVPLVFQKTMLYYLCRGITDVLIPAAIKRMRMPHAKGAEADHEDAHFFDPALAELDRIEQLLNLAQRTDWRRLAGATCGEDARVFFALLEEMYRLREMCGWKLR